MSKPSVAQPLFPLPEQGNYAGTLKRILIRNFEILEKNIKPRGSDPLIFFVFDVQVGKQIVPICKMYDPTMDKKGKWKFKPLFGPQAEPNPLNLNQLIGKNFQISIRHGNYSKGVFPYIKTAYPSEKASGRKRLRGGISHMSGVESPFMRFLIEHASDMVSFQQSA